MCVVECTFVCRAERLFVCQIIMRNRRVVSRDNLKSKIEIRGGCLLFRVLKISCIVSRRNFHSEEALNTSGSLLRNSVVDLGTIL